MVTSVPGAPIVDAPRHRAAVLALAAAVLALHAWLLGGVAIVWPGSASEAPRAASVQARAVELPAVALPPPVATEPPAAAVPAPQPAAPRPKPARPATLSRVAEPAPAAVAAPTPPPEPAAEGDLPLYRTALPPAATLQYELTLGRLAGSATLSWQPQGDRYAASLDGRVAGLSMLAQSSRGALTHHGLEPERFTDRRPRRGELAVNFDAEAGKVTFSGPSTVLDRHAGMQDRLSWVLQLAAIVAAEPARLAEGESVSLHLIGPRGDAGVWVLRSTGAQAVDTPAGPQDAVRFVRDPRGLYDSSVEVWLAAAPPHWPVRLRMGNGTEAGGIEWVLAAPGRP